VPTWCNKQILKIKGHPIIARYTQSSFETECPFQVATTVSKRRFRKAVSRSRIKRLMRETWRLEKYRLLESWTPGDKKWGLVFIYVGRDIPTFDECSHNIRQIVDVLLEHQILEHESK
jgi:ribonuclease P protein component